MLVGGSYTRTSSSSNKNFSYGALSIEAGFLIFHHASMGLRARAFTNLIGGAVSLGPLGDFTRYGAGIEARSCTGGGVLCWFADLDIGYQMLQVGDNGPDLQDKSRGLLLGPRIGADLGGALRLRVAIELYFHLASDSSGNVRSASVGQAGTGGLALGLVGQF